MLARTPIRVNDKSVRGEREKKGFSSLSLCLASVHDHRTPESLDPSRGEGENRASGSFFFGNLNLSAQCSISHKIWHIKQNSPSRGKDLQGRAHHFLNGSVDCNRKCRSLEDSPDFLRLLQSLLFLIVYYAKVC